MFFSKISRIIYVIKDAIMAIDMIGRLVGCFFLALYLIGQVFNILYPFPFIVIIVALAILTFSSRRTAWMSVAGIILFALSWPVTDVWGIWIGMTVWGIGIVIFFHAVFESILKVLILPIEC